MKPDREWIIGVTHLIKPPFDPEKKAFRDNVRFIHFPDSDEREFSKDSLSEVDGLLVWTPSIGVQTIRHLAKCQIIVRYGVGYDKIDLPTLNNAGIAFSNNPEYGPEDVADTAIGLILTLQRGLIQHDERARTYGSTWQENHIVPMLHSPKATVGIVGLGRIGTSVARRLSPFGYKTLAYDPYLSNGMFRALQVERATSLQELVDEADVLTLHCPLTAETESMINAELLRAAKRGLLLVNTARGRLIDSLDTLEEGLVSGRIGGVGLDVLPEEPPGSHRLINAWRRREEWTLGRIIITPHNAFFSDYSMNECRFAAAETARLFLEENIHRNQIPSR